MGAKTNAVRILEQAGIPTFDTPVQAVRALGHMARRALWLQERSET